MDRSLYCKAVTVIEGPSNEGKEEAAMKLIFGDEKPNLKAVANWYASKKEIKISSYQEARKWQLRPAPEEDENTGDSTVSTDTMFIMPGKIAYELKWSATEIFSKDSPT